jgi:hypothetical protein
MKNEAKSRKKQIKIARNENNKKFNAKMSKNAQK